MVLLEEIPPSMENHSNDTSYIFLARKTRPIIDPLYERKETMIDWNSRQSVETARREIAKKQSDILENILNLSERSYKRAISRLQSLQETYNMLSDRARELSDMTKPKKNWFARFMNR